MNRITICRPTWSFTPGKGRHKGGVRMVNGWLDLFVRLVGLALIFAVMIPLALRGEKKE